MDNQIPWKKLARYVTGECSSEERLEIENWIEDEPDRRAFVEELEELWKKSDQQNKWDVDSAWETISGRLLANRPTRLRLVESFTDEVNRIRHPRFSGRKKKIGIYIAASLVLIATVMGAVLYYYSMIDPEPSAPLTMQEVVSEVGQRSQFRLSDGTQVWLNADSKLKIPTDFTYGTRNVHLDGEAFFKVKPDTDRPFVVETARSITKVLGTQFNIQAYSDEEEVQLIVEEGRVAFGRPGDSIESAPELTNKQMGILTDKRQTVIRDIENLDRYIGWTTGKLIFQDTPMVKVIRKLERWYDIDCTIIDTVLTGRTVTASFEDESLTEVLKILSLSVGMTYEKDKRRVTFSSR